MEQVQLNLNKENIKDIGLFKRTGEFKNEKGDLIHFTSYTLALKIGEYPVEFRFKGDNIVKEYIEEALNAEAN